MVLTWSGLGIYKRNKESKKTRTRPRVRVFLTEFFFAWTRACLRGRVRVCFLFFFYKFPALGTPGGPLGTLYNRFRILEAPTGTFWGPNK